MNAQLHDYFSAPSQGLDYGLGLRVPHFGDVKKLGKSPGKKPVSWFEAISENYFDDDADLQSLRQIRRDFAVAFHGVTLNLGSTDPLREDNLKTLKERVDEFEPWVVSDHLCWTGINGQSMHNLLPLPYTEEALTHFCARVGRVQDFLGRQILIENLSSYLQFEHDEMAEWDFLSQLARRSGCGLLLDINNVYVSSVNHGFDPVTFIRALAPESVKQIHLAGHSVETNARGRKVLIDTHDTDVCEDVWRLYFASLPHLGFKPVMIERDGNIPSFAELCRELERAKQPPRVPDLAAAGRSRDATFIASASI